MMKKPFTLMEMLLVMAIIGILTAILIPLLSKVQNTSKVNQAKTEVNTLKLAIDAYYNDYGALPYDGSLMDQIYIGNYPAKESETDKVYDATIGAGAKFSAGSKVEKVYTILQMPCDGTPGYVAQNGNYTWMCNNFKLFQTKNPNAVRYLPLSYSKWSVPFAGCSQGTGWHGLSKANDPWDRPYLFYLDGNADGQIKVHESFNLDGDKLSNHVGIVSLGSRLKGTVDDVLKKHKDIVTSW